MTADRWVEMGVLHLAKALQPHLWPLYPGDLQLSEVDRIIDVSWLAVCQGAAPTL